MTVGVISLTSLLQQGVPWWYGERYQLRVLDLGGSVLASRSKIDAPASAASHRIAFDPPGNGLFLEATPYRQETNLVRNGLATAIVLLMLLVVWSIRALRQHDRSRVAAENALREQYAFRKAMEDSLQTGLRARDLDGRITYVNPAFCRMVGWSAAELVGQRPPMPYWIDAEIDIAAGWNARILAGQAPLEGFEIRFQRRSGEIFWALIHEAPLVNAQGRHTGWMGSIVDITPQKLTEERERQQQERLQATARLVAMGEMASSLAHELNQPLAAISSYTTGSLNLIDSGQTSLTEIRGVLAKTQEQAQRAGRIIRRIYEFVRRAEPKSEPCRPVELIQEIADLAEVDAQRLQVRVVREIPAELPVIQGDRILLGQALLNLMRNGIEAMRDCPHRPCVLVVAAAVEAGQLRISIADRGPGIPPEVAARLFEPFYTTKAEGMGMGLNIARSIVEAHRGRLAHAPNPEGGSIFTITLPISTA
jgi:two-component system sensor histidine kinase DctS